MFSEHDMPDELLSILLWHRAGAHENRNDDLLQSVQALNGLVDFLRFELADLYPALSLLSIRWQGKPA